MTRPRKQTVDYFPHDSHASEGKTLFIMQSKYKNDGYAFWFKLLEQLASSEGHFIDLNDPVSEEYLRSKAGLDRITTHDNPAPMIYMLDLLAKLGAIDPELWVKKVIWCQKLVDGIADVYTRNRHLSVPERPLNYAEESHAKAITTQVNPQSKVKESKVKESISSSENKVSDIALKLADKLKSLILINNPTGKVPKNLKRWADDIDRMIRLDKRTEAEIEAIITFSQQDSFWHANILSGQKLREKYDQLYLKMKGNDNGQSRQTITRSIPGNAPSGAFADIEP